MQLLCIRRIVKWGLRDMKDGMHALERALIFRRLRLSLRDLFFFHFSLMLQKWQRENEQDELNWNTGNVLVVEEREL